MLSCWGSSGIWYTVISPSFSTFDYCWNTVVKSIEKLEVYVNDPLIQSEVVSTVTKITKEIAAEGTGTKLISDFVLPTVISAAVVLPENSPEITKTALLGSAELLKETVPAIQLGFGSILIGGIGVTVIALLLGPSGAIASLVGLGAVKGSTLFLTSVGVKNVTAVYLIPKIAGIISIISSKRFIDSKLRDLSVPSTPNNIDIEEE